MKKIFLILLFFAFGIVLCTDAKAAGADYIEDMGDEMSWAVTEDARDFLDENNITPDNNGAANLTFTGVLKSVWDIFASKVGQPIKVLCSLCGAILLCALANSVSPDNSLKGVLSAVGALCGAGICASAIIGVINEALGVLSALANFMLVFIPSFAGIAAALGYIGTASAVNSAVIAASQLFSQICVNLLAPLCSTILALSIAGAVHPELKIEKAGEVIKKLTVWGLSLIMTVFMGVLSVQTAVVSSSDGTAIKAAKFLVSQGVPFVGGTISDAVGTVGSGLEILKSSVGTYGIIAAAAMIIPVIATLVCYHLVFSAAEAAAEMFDLKPLAALSKSCVQIMSIILAVCACFLLLSFVSVVLLLSMTK
ncbi:MAG: hypothetical protein J1F03_01250 [Oscillospiraceae bacterium]|nr:hypothetical protein [Oscillospiraceae bacterium]